MSVIGRLDGQVEEVIIKPVGRRHAPDDTGATGDAPAPPHAARRDEPRETQPAERPDESRGERSGDGELPVWLL
jgi:hypothetical protein